MDIEEIVLFIEYEYNLLFWVDFFDIFFDFDSNIWFFNYCVLLIEIKFGVFIFFVFFRCISFVVYCSYENLK